MRGGTPSPEKPLRGNQKTAFNTVDKLLQIADAIVVSRMGEECGIHPVERFLIADGATTYMTEGTAAQITKYIGPGALAVGVGLWGWRVYDEMQLRRDKKAGVRPNPVIQMMRDRGGAFKANGKPPAEVDQERIVEELQRQAEAAGAEWRAVIEPT